MSNDQLIIHVTRQIDNIFGKHDSVDPYLDEALLRTQNCFRMAKDRYNKMKLAREFSPYHSGQYAIFLYYLANTIYRTSSNTSLATLVYYLNKILHSVDWYYEIELPEYWSVEHPLGSVLGRAKYSNGLLLYQGCTVGGNKGKYPIIGENVILFSNATVLGQSILGNNVVVSTGSTIKDDIIPDNCLVFGQSPNLVIKIKSTEFMETVISESW